MEGFTMRFARSFRGRSEFIWFIALTIIRKLSAPFRELFSAIGDNLSYSPDRPRFQRHFCWSRTPYDGSGILLPRSKHRMSLDLRSGSIVERARTISLALGCLWIPRSTIFWYRKTEVFPAQATLWIPYIIVPWYNRFWIHVELGAFRYQVCS